MSDRIDRIAFTGTVTTEGRNIRGSVVLAGFRTFRNNEWVEVDPAAVVKADATDVMARFDHEPNKVLGRTTNGTLTVNRTDQGIDYEIRDLPNTTYANDALELVRGGYVPGSSFEIEGMRSTFSTDPDGTRVRRITSIKRLSDVSPTFDPAFPSSAAAFSKESDVTEKTEAPEIPKADPPKTEAPKVEVPAQFTQTDTYATAEAFARKQDLGGLEAAMENILTGEMTPAKSEVYDAFAKVYDERKKADAEAKDRFERMKLAQDLRRGKGPKAPKDDADLFASDDYLEAWSGKRGYMRTGDPRGLEQFAQAVAGDGSQGGYAVPDGYRNVIVERMVAYGGIAGLAETLTTSTGESLRWPSNDDTANTAAIAAEGVAGTAGADLTFGNIELGAFSYDANGTGNVPLKVSLELIQDAAFDIASFVGRKLGERIGRKQATDLANGGGGTAPTGLFTKAADTMTATVASLAAPEHVFQVDAAYRDGGNCRFVMSDTTLVKFWQAQAAGLPIFIPGGSSIGASPHGTLYGFPVSIDAAAGNNVAFGDIRAGYIIRRVRGVQVLVDPYTAQGTRQIAYHAWARMDATIQDSNAYSVSSYSGVSADT
jgi:HK97 family phage major capsid protein